jgi:hypothetical protein
MSRRRIDEQELIRKLSRAGSDVELDAERILDLVEDRSKQSSGAGIGFRGRSIERLRLSRRLLAVPIVATVAAGVVGSQVLIASGQDRTMPREPPWPGVTAPATSSLGGSQSITTTGVGSTAPETKPSVTPSQRGAAGGPSSTPVLSAVGPGATTVTRVSGLTIEVSRVAAGVSYRLPRTGNAIDTLVLVAEASALAAGTGTNGATAVHLPSGGTWVGAAQRLGGPELAVMAGPYQLDWSGFPGTSGTTTSDSWLTSARPADGSTAGMRLPVRTPHPFSTISLYAGTIGGAGQLRLEVSLGGGGKRNLTAALPDCGRSVCADLVTITLDPSLGGQGTPNVVIDLSATTSGARVGLAAAELD